MLEQVFTKDSYLSKVLNCTAKWHDARFSVNFIIWFPANCFNILIQLTLKITELVYGWKTPYYDVVSQHLVG